MHKSKIQGPGTPGSPSSVWIGTRGTRELSVLILYVVRLAKQLETQNAFFLLLHHGHHDIYGAAYLRMLES